MPHRSTVFIQVLPVTLVFEIELNSIQLLKERKFSTLPDIRFRNIHINTFYAKFRS